MRNRQRSGTDEIRAVQDQIEIDDARCVASTASSAEARFDRVQRVEQGCRREVGIAGHDRVLILRWRRFDRIRFDEAADADDVDHAS